MPRPRPAGFARFELVELAGGGHPATTALTAAGHFNLVLDAITGDRLDTGLIRRAHRIALRAMSRSGLAFPWPVP